MTPLVATLARVNREIAQAMATGNTSALADLIEARDELRYLIGTDRLMGDLDLVANMVRVAS